VISSAVPHRATPHNLEQQGDCAAHIWALTDGQPTVDWMAAADRLRNMDAVGMFNAIAIGADVDSGVLAQIVGSKGQASSSRT